MENPERRFVVQLAREVGISQTELLRTWSQADITEQLAERILAQQEHDAEMKKNNQN